MIKELSIVVRPFESIDLGILKEIVSQETGQDINDISHIETIKKSIDARGGKVRVNLKLKVFVNEQPETKLIWQLKAGKIKEKYRKYRQ